MSDIANAICDAIDIIVSKAVEEASYDKTIQATVVSCVDETIGKYKVSYQDSTFYAYSTSTDVTYPSGTSVYVLIPDNDMSRDKTILGTTKKLGVNYVVATEGDEAYEYVGNNIIQPSTRTFGMSSYREGTYVDVLYSKDFTDSQNQISIDKTAMVEYLTSAENIICGGEVRTALPAEQQYRGNYGIIFALDFLDNTSNEVVTRYYTVDVDKMVGNPYKLIYSTRQYGIFDIDAENFIEVNYISLFCYDFPNHLPDEQCIDDIFITNLELSGANRLSNDDLDSYSLTFVTAKGTFFTSDNLDSDTLTIEAQVRVKGKVIDNESQSLPFYWGTENVGITTQSRYYNTYLGQGWKCLNESNVVQGDSSADDAVVEWLPASYIWTVKKSDVIAQSVDYKCAVVYEGTVLIKTITIKNLGSEWDITIDSDSGTQFYFDIGYPTLTCYVNNESKSGNGYTYAWACVNNVGSFSSLAETPDLNAEYNELVTEYNQLLTNIENGTKFANACADELQALELKIASYDTVTRIEENIVHHLNVNTITNFSTYKCSVSLNDVYLGTASIILLNTYDTEGTYSLVINNGSYVYKYNESGISPACGAVDSPIDIKALTFTIYDNLGQVIEDDVASHCDIQWIVPTINTLIEIPSMYTPDSEDEENHTATYKNLMSFSYTIANTYDVSKNNNDIYLIVDYKGMSLSAKTDLVFLKEGEPGTNGTDFVLRIVPNVSTGTAPKYLIITESSTGVYTYNYTASNNRFLKVQFWHNENEIYDGVSSGNTTEAKAIDITWEILKNKYTSLVYDNTSLAIDESSGEINYSGYRSDSPAHIVKATAVYDGITYYTTFPVLTVKLSNDSYNITLKEGSGFQFATYTSDGRTPKYDNANPFEITTTRLIDGYWEDVSTVIFSNYQMSYEWSYLGQLYEDSQWIEDINLADKLVTDELASNQKAVKPKDEFDGECVTNAIECVVKDSGGSEVARIHIPVHLMLNRYGLAFINGWDGNSVEINEDGGFILAPQVGAGQKENDNSFTGVVIGKVKESNKSDAEIGLFGYNCGTRTIFLDSQTGKSVFGASGKAQIIIDPGDGKDGKALLYSGNFYDENGNEVNDGLLIDLTTPEIRYGNGNFYVNKEGHLVAKGGGEIAGFNIDNDSLWTTIGNNTNKDYNYNFRIASVGFNRTVNSQSVTNLALASSNNFGIDMDGKFYASEGVVGKGSNKIIISQSSESSTHSAIYYNKDNFYSTNSGFYIGSDGISLGNYNANTYDRSPFQVTSDGELTARSGYIGNGKNGWTIGNTYIYNNKSSYTAAVDEGGVYLGTNGIALGTYTTSDGVSASAFQVSSNGELTAKSGFIGNGNKGWTIGSNSIYNGKSSRTSDSEGVYIGTDYIALGKYDSTSKSNPFQVSSSGDLFARSGTIGGWTLNTSTLKASTSDGSIILDAEGSITGGGSKDNWYVKADGSASFSNITATGGTFTNIDVNSGTIGGWTINRTSISSGGITLSSNGTITLSGDSSIVGSNWSITPSVARFSNIEIDGGSISVGGNDLTVGGTTINNTYITETVTNAINADSIKSALGISDNNTSWTSRQFMDSITVYTEYIPYQDADGTTHYTTKKYAYDVAPHYSMLYYYGRAETVGS